VASWLLTRLAMRTSRTLPASREVTIVSANPETRDRLESYLRSVGVPARGRRTLEECSELTSASTFAIVLFPDDFWWEAVVATIAELDARCSSALRVFVTAQPQKYQQLVDGRPNVLVVPRSVWGWMILDAIRSHADASS